jgi:aerobic C4-dicarboxylate transport protein
VLEGIKFWKLPDNDSSRTMGTLLMIPTIPVAGIAIILGFDRFMSMFRELLNIVVNGVATIVVARSESEVDRAALARNLG